MSRAWFGLLLGLAAVAVAVGSFFVGLQVLDDDGPDAPPAAAPGDGATGEGTGTDGDPSDADDSGAEADADGGGDDEGAALTEPDALATPAWVLVVSSEGGEDRAREVAAAVIEAGHPAGVLRSDDHPSLNPGFWVAYAGPYPDADAAQAAQPEVRAAGFPGAYLRCAGPTAECGGDQPLDPDG